MLSLVTLVPAGGAGTSAVELTILHTNDKHSAVIPFDPAIDYTPAVGDDPTVGGFARLATEIDRIKTTKALENEPVLTLSAGDFLMGTLFSWLGGVGLTPELTLMQQMGYDAVTIGNHEYDWTADYLASYLSAAGYPATAASMPIVASNINITGHPLDAMGMQPYIVKEMSNNLTVGIFGIIGYDAIFVSPLAGIPFLDPLETAAEMVEALTTLNVDLIICLSHSGVEEDMDMASAVPGIDIIVGGHSHDALFEPIIVGETIVVQAGNSGLYLGMLELSVAEDGVSIRNYDTENPFLIPIDDSISASPSISSSIEFLYVPALNQMVFDLTGGMFDEILDVVAESEFDLLQPPLTETGLGNIITDSMRAIVDVFQNPVTNDTVDFSFEANGVIRGSVLRGSIPGKEGLISLYDLHAAVGLGAGLDEYPGYPVVSCYLTAEEIRRVCRISMALSFLMGDTYFLQVSGLRFEYDPGFAPPLVTKIEKYVGLGSPADGTYFKIYEDGIWYVDPTELYKVAVNIYIMYFLPFIAEQLPPLVVVPKDQAGNPILDPAAPIVYQAPEIELKIWQAVLYYVANFPDIDSDSIPDVPPWYDGPMCRVTEKKPPMQTKVFDVTQFGQTFCILTESTSVDVSNLAFDWELKRIEFEVTGFDGTTGACNVTIPKALLDADPGDWTIVVDGTPVTPVVTENATHSFLYFLYYHSTHTVKITGTRTIESPPVVGGKATPINMPTIQPELQIPWIWIMMIIISLIATALRRCMYACDLKMRKRNVNVQLNSAQWLNGLRVDRNGVACGKA